MVPECDARANTSSRGLLQSLLAFALTSDTASCRPVDQEVLRPKQMTVIVSKDEVKSGLITQQMHNESLKQHTICRAPRQKNPPNVRS